MVSYITNLSLVIIVVGIFTIVTLLPIKKSYAAGCPPSCPGTCDVQVFECSQGCECLSDALAEQSEEHFTDEITTHYDDVFVGEFWDGEDFIHDNMRQMTAQLGAVGMNLVNAVGMFFDAKHQLETQRLFQQLVAKAHKDYHPSVGMCDIGTNVRSLNPSYRNSDLTTAVFSKRSIARQSLSFDMTSKEGNISDGLSRLLQFVDKYCNPDDNLQQLDLLCERNDADPILYNRDINYTESVGRHLTLDIDFSETGAENTEDEQAVFALSSYLFAHTVMPEVSNNTFVTEDGIPNQNAAQAYLDARSLVAKRSVAMNSYAAIAGLKSKGTDESQPFIYSIINELSDDAFLDGEAIEALITDRPSYHAQMEVLTKKIYQHPNFYTELYDKPANVLRKDVSVQAIQLMQKRDIFRSLLRSEAMLAVMLETALIEEQNKVDNEASKLKEEGPVRAF